MANTKAAEQIRKVSAEAAEHGDLEMVAICDRALAGDAEALAECVRVLVGGGARSGARRLDS